MKKTTAKAKRIKSDRSVKRRLIWISVGVVLLVIGGGILFLRRFMADNMVYELEVERKWLLDVASLPFDIDGDNGGWRSEFTQSYFTFEDPEVRVRKDVNGNGEVYYKLTVKTKLGDQLLARPEWDWPISEFVYNLLLPHAKGQTIEKTRFGFENGDGYLLEIDVFRGALAPLALMEIEFPSVEEANAYVPPEFVVADVTEDKGFKNASLARDGIPANWEELMSKWEGEE